MFNQNNLSSREENLISVLMQRYLPFWPLFVVLLVITLSAAWIYLQYATPVFETSATLIIKDENKGVDDSKIMESMNAFASKKIVENEIEVIRSRALMKQVVNDLHLYAPIFEDKGIRSASAYTTSPIAIELKNPESLANNIEEFDKIYFSYDSLQKEVKVNNISYPIDKWIKSPYGTLKFFISEKQSYTTTNPLYFTLIDPRIVTANLLNNLDVVSANKLSTVVSLKLEDPVPQKGEDILNQLIYFYNEASIEDKNTLAVNTLAFIEDRIKYVEKDLNELETELQRYKSTKGVVDLSEQGKLYLQNVGDNDRKIADINLQLAVLDKVEKYVISKDNKGGIVPSTLGVKDDVLSQLLEKLYNAEIEYERLRKTTAENNPILVSVSNEIEKIRPGILENVENQRVNLQASLENLNSTSGKYNSALQTIPQKERELMEISRRKSMKNELFSFLLQKREETALSYAPSVGDSRVVDMAESSIMPVSPKRSIILPIAVVIAFVFGVSFVEGKELLSNKILFRSEIEGYTEAPVIGELSLVNQKKKKQVNDQDYQFLLEQFRDLRVRLGLYRRTTSKKRILVTSSIEGEGKSFISENLAFSLASSGKVVLINFDLRKPNTSAIFDIADQNGVAEYLAGKTESFDLIKSTKHNNLYVIPSGNTSESTSNALLDVDLTNLFTYLEDVFDYIIIDTPPVCVAADAYLLSHYCDISLYIVRHQYTPKKMMEHFEHNIQVNELKKPLIVFNGVKSRGLVKTGYGYGYGYKYSYSNKVNKKVLTNKA